jgi:hypothetical protein
MAKTYVKYVCMYRYILPRMFSVAKNVIKWPKERHRIIFWMNEILSVIVFTGLRFHVEIQNVEKFTQNVEFI